MNKKNADKKNAERKSDGQKCIFTSYRGIESCDCNSDCKYYINSKKCNNCVLEFSNEGRHTLEEVAEAMDYTPTGVMVIQNNSLRKLKKRLPKDFLSYIYD